MIKYAKLSSFLAGRTWIQGSLSVVHNSFLKVFIYFMTAHLTHFVVPVYGMLWFTVAMNVLVRSNFVSTRNEHRKLMQEFHKRLFLQAKISQTEVIS